MLRFIIFCCFFCCLTNLNANKDSLWTIWAEETNVDSTRLDALYELAFVYYEENLDSALQLLDLHLEYAKAINNKQAQAAAHKFKGNVYLDLGEKEQGIFHLKKALDFYQISQDKENEALVHLSIHIYFSELGLMDEALKSAEEVYQIGQNIKDKGLIFSGLYDIAYCHAYNDNLVEALTLLLKCVNILEQEKIDLSNVSDPYHNIGIIYRQLNNVEAAILNFEKSITFNDKYSSSTEGQSTAYANLGGIYYDQGFIEKAETAYAKSLELAEASIYPLDLIAPLTTYSGFLLGEGRVESINSINRLFDFSKDLELPLEEALAHVYKGRYYLLIKQRNQAVRWCKKGYSLTKRFGTFQHQMEACRCLYEAYNELGNHQKALSWFEEYNILNDSILNEENIRETTQLQLQYEFDKQKLQDSLANQQAIQLLEKDKAILAVQNRNYIIAATSIGLLALTAFGFFFNIRRKNQQINQQKVTLETQKSQLEQANTTKDQLFSIISHDLRKPALAFRGISEKVNYLVQKKDFNRLHQFGEGLEKSAFSLNALLDNLLNWALTQREVLTLKPRLVNVSRALEEVLDLLNPFAKAKNIDLKVDLSSNAQAFIDDNALVTIIRNLLDNAIKFTPAGGQIRLSATAESTTLKLKIEDNGVGMNPDKLAHIFELSKAKSTSGTNNEKGTGLGLSLVKDLVELSKGNIQVRSKEGEGTIFEVLLPLAAN